VNVLSLFDGMSGGQLALRRAGFHPTYYACEIDKYAIMATQHNFPYTIQLGDITKYQPWLIVDLVIAGSPCQDLSGLKNGAGLNGNKSRLFFEFVRILKQTQPKYFLLENVVPRKKEWKDQIDRILGVEGILINSDRFVRQNRPRIYWTNIPIEELPKRPRWRTQYYQYRRTYFRENKSGVCPCLTANMGTGGHNVPLKSQNLDDRLTPKECLELQGFPKNYLDLDISNTQKYKMIGNSFTVPVISHILKGIK
jgi:site-specific DNA-cytosine methylase